IGSKSWRLFQCTPTQSPDKDARSICLVIQFAQADSPGWCKRCRCFSRRHWLSVCRFLIPGPPSSFGRQVCSQTTSQHAPFVVVSPDQRKALRFLS
ncbi:hypothetical protein PVAP13_9KG129970, partial [Panicum virgatum]